MDFAIFKDGLQMRAVFFYFLDKSYTFLDSCLYGMWKLFLCIDRGGVLYF